MSLALRDRIALYYLGVASLLALFLFIAIYGVVYQTVYAHLDSDLEAEALELGHTLVILDNEIMFANPNEWKEREHGQIEVNPTFMEVVDPQGHSIRRSPNLGDGHLAFDPDLKEKGFRDTRLAAAPVRQLQQPITNPTGKRLGYMVVAVPLADARLVLDNLRTVLLVTIPLSLLVLFVVSRSIAGRSIAPLDRVIATAERISRESLDARMPLPPNEDELHRLAVTLNGLMGRLEKAFEREKQFTADASHELRTPLSIIRGTLEVLIRRPREPEHYEEKIRTCIAEVDRMSSLVEQLLLLARYESGTRQADIRPVVLAESMADVLERLQGFIEEKQLTIGFDPLAPDTVSADPVMLDIILENLLSNAVKYSTPGQRIDIGIERRDDRVRCTIRDRGAGMTREQARRIFDRFYRVDPSRDSSTPGVGLGLSIVRRLVELQGLDIDVDSTPGEGTCFTVRFPN